MKSFINGKLNNMNVPMRVVRLVGTINEYKGKQELYRQQSPQLLEGLKKVANDIDPLILTSAFILDFLSIHPFNDGNGRMARILTLLLLYKFGYEVGRFISLEKIIEQTKEQYYSTLHQSSEGWHEGEHNLLPWTEYFLGIIIAAYRDFEERVGVVDDTRGSKSERIENTISHIVGEFTKDDVRRLCPDVGESTINRALSKLKEEGKIDVTGKGRNASWVRIT